MALDQTSIQSYTIYPEGDMNVPNFIAIHPIVVEIFQSGPKCLTVKPQHSVNNTSVAKNNFLGCFNYYVYWQKSLNNLSLVDLKKVFALFHGT